MKKLWVKEGSTGVLELDDGKGNRHVYQPDCNLDKTIELIYELFELRTIDGLKVKDSFQIDGIDWFPSAVSLLYWQYYYQVVKYMPLIDDYLCGNVVFCKRGSGRFINTIKLIDPPSNVIRDKFRSQCRRLYNFALMLRNRWVPHKKGDVLFFRYGVHDFRTNQLLENMQKRLNILQVAGVPIKELPRYIFKPNVYILCSYLPSERLNILLSGGASKLHVAALRYVNHIINANIASYNSHAKLFKKMNYRLFFGLDDTNIVYPLIYAAQDAGIKSLGYQHGVYAKRHIPFFMKNIERYQWYDNVLLWGKYWKEVACRNTDIFSSEYYFLASNKHSYDYRQINKKINTKSVLVPYEFLADTITVGKYIKKFIERGFVVYFKPRVDESVNEQLDSYYLDEYVEKLKIVYDITPDIMSDIGIVAGTQTTLLYDLLPYNKPVWILDTPFHLLYDMVEDNLARLVTMENMDDIDDIYELDIKKGCNINAADISGVKPVEEAILEYLQTGTVSE